MTEQLAVLTTGALHHFRDWPNAAVPSHAAGVYTVWRGDELVYVGMAGRGLTAAAIADKRAAGAWELLLGGCGYPPPAPRHARGASGG